MPAFLTHRAAGEEVFARLTKNAIPQRMAFYLGCQGPDMLFFRNYQPWRSCKKSLLLGIKMHKEKTRELLTNALEYLRLYDKKDKDELVSYIAGFITHYSIDKNAHPFVYNKAGVDTNVHNATEFMWDSYVAKEQWGIEPQQFDFFSEVMYGKIGSGICEWYSEAAKGIYNSILSTKAVIQAQLHLAKAKEALSNIRLPGKVLMKFVGGLLGIDLSNMLYPEQRDESLFTNEEYSLMRRMVSKGVDEACDMAGFMLEYINGADVVPPLWFGEKNFSGEAAQI